VVETAYLNAVEDAQRSIVRFLRAFEETQQTILFADIGAAVTALRVNSGNSLSNAAAALDSVAPLENEQDLHREIRQIVDQLRSVQETVLGGGDWPEFATAFMASRSRYCQALEILYRWRTDLPIIEPYFRLGDPDDLMSRLPDTDSNATEVGILHRAKSAAHNHYSLYVPEYYDESKKWPLVVCLHGGYGRGDEYLWTWLRSARSRGYIVLSPNSHAQTWSIMQPALDVGSITAMMDEVCATYTIDKSRIYLSGLSDGGTFSYLLGLEHHERFAAIAPIAGVLSPTAGSMLRKGRGKDLPFHVVHGALDSIFPVQSARSTNELLNSLGYNLTYTELPQWGHALTYAINEQTVLPWFEQL
jgi:phospholipase/carboxylesterase